MATRRQLCETGTSKRKAKTPKSRSKTESCALCEKVPGITPEMVADPRTVVCKPGEFEKMLDGGTTLVEIRQDGCSACKTADEQIMPKIQGKKIQVTLGTIPACDTLADKLKVSATPTFIIYKDSKEMGRLEGVTRADKDLTEIKRLLSA